MARRARINGRPAVRIRGENKGNDDKESKPGRARVVEEIVENRIDKDTAQTILKALRDAGVDPGNSRNTRAFILRRSFTALAGQLLGVGTSLFALYASAEFFAAVSATDSPFKAPLQVVLGALAVLFSLELGGRSVGFLTTVLATLVYNTDAEAFIRAVQDVAGEGAQSGSSVPGVGTVQDAVSQVKVFNELKDLVGSLRERVQRETESKEGRSFLDDLDAYLKLNEAEKMYGVDPQVFGASESEAIRVARAFSRFDLDGSGTLDVSELKKLCSSLSMEMGDEEADAAMKVLDRNRDGRCQFGEFLLWYTGQLAKPEEESAQSNEAASQ